MAGAYIGIDGLAYYSLTGVSGTWVPMDIIGDVRIPLAHVEATVKDRSSEWEKVLIGLKQGSVSFRVTRRTAHTVWEALRDAWVAKTMLGFAFMSGIITTVGSEGLQLDAEITNFECAEPDDDAAVAEVTVKPSARSTTDPTFVEISA